MRRVCDRTTPNLPVYDDNRAESRYNRSIPILVCPTSAGVTLLDESLIGVTSNLSEHSIGLITHSPLNWLQGIAGIWLGPKIMDAPRFFQVSIQATRQVGGGFWQAGIQLDDALNRRESADLGILNQAVLRLMPEEST